MKRSLLYIGILFSAVSCGRNDHALQSGDLLFQAGESSDMTGAITAATGENGRLNFSHVGLAVVKNGADTPRAGKRFPEKKRRIFRLKVAECRNFRIFAGYV